MKTILTTEIIEKVKRACIDANLYQDEKIRSKMIESIEKEESPLGKEILSQLVKSAEISAKEELAICQDTGVSVFYVEIGEDVKIDGNDEENLSKISSAINEAVRQAYKEAYLRKSIVKDPLRRVNTNDNTPAMITFDIVKGDSLKVSFMAKGAGCENMSALKMFAPAVGIEGIKKFVVDTVIYAHANPCPPIVVGIGIGGSFEKVAYLAKKALFRHVGERHPDPFYANLELELLDLINKTGVGPQGFGGITTALDVMIEVLPCHIASLPVAINIDCHAHRMRTVVF
ncbi:MAG TPA: fumarate hydratase [Ignavibacteria bacterium]|jgi:fumarate hydratase subunit alpha